MIRSFLALTLVAFLTALQTQGAGLPEKLRVLSVDLENTLLEAPGAPGGQVAQQLRTLLENADPDVVCLQGVMDWETGERVCALKPGLRLITCSAFESPTGASPSGQVAVLARDRALISWVEEVSTNSGFAFALFEAGDRKLGIFSLQSSKSPAPTAAITERVLVEIGKLKKFPQNRPDAFLLAGSPLTKTSPLIENGLQNISSEAPAEGISIRSEFWVAHAGFIARPRAVAISGLKTPAIVSDFDSASSFSSKFAYQTPLLFAGETPASLQAITAPSQPEGRSLIWPLSIGAGVLLVFLLMFLRRGAPESQMQLVPLNGPQSLTNVGPNEHARAGLIEWLKTAFVQRLVSQRQNLLANEAEATRRTMVIEEKLSSLQSTLQTRISAYETRIERLEHELTAATAENRDLIRSQIDLLKEKVAKAKEEHEYRRN